MNPRLARLHPYPFQRLASLIGDITTDDSKPAIHLSVGEPRHAPPEFVLEAVRQHLDGLSVYPTTRGEPGLRQAIAGWLQQRFRLATPPDPDRHVIPASGTREALFSIAQAVVDGSAKPQPVVMMPNPFYQIYEGAALLAGAEPYYLNTTADNDYQIDIEAVPTDIWRRTALIYVCSPGNPTGAVLGHEAYARLLQLAEQHDFIIASDECYSEIYFDAGDPPLGLLQVADKLGIQDYRRCLVFHSLSKRSNLPGLRSGFVAGDGEAMAQYLQYRTYHGATLSPVTQAASTVAWQDETHVVDNRQRYQEKFTAVLAILQTVLDVYQPDAGFYLWPRVPLDDTEFTHRLLAQENVLVLPGSYLSRDANGINPGRNYVRLALVGTLEECVEAAERIKRFIEKL